MKARALLLAAAVALLWHAPALAQQSVEERLLNMEKRIRQLEERVSAQDKVIVEKDKQISRLTGGDKWFEAVEIGGAIDIRGIVTSPPEGDNETDLVVDSVELGIGAQVNDWVSGEVVLLYEGEGVDVDSATLTIGPPEGAWSLTAGQLYLPFGAFETNLISDPLTLDIGETGQNAVQLDVSTGALSWSVFVFKGDNMEDGDNLIQGMGAAVGYSVETETFELGLNLSYTNDLGDSDGLEVEGAEGYDRVAGISASAMLTIGSISVLGEYLGAMDTFGADYVAFGDYGAKPSAWMVEVAYGFELGGKGVTLAASYQTTDEALAIELPKKRMLVGLSSEVMDGLSLGFEWARDTDYSADEGGSGENTDNFTLQLAAEF
ncbi:MAG: LbtU family siderophore porin [Nitrospinae bacterium]|nr:LbtU family siderophore porin [Nitrospinota bacterium]